MEWWAISPGLAARRSTISIRRLPKIGVEVWEDMSRLLIPVLQRVVSLSGATTSKGEDPSEVSSWLKASRTKLWGLDLSGGAMWCERSASWEPTICSSIRRTRLTGRR